VINAEVIRAATEQRDDLKRVDGGENEEEEEEGGGGEEEEEVNSR
jgi:hypothetical protein